jgi:hypothetical protein
VPAALKEKPWLVETYREDRVLVPDPSLFDVAPYRPGSVERAIKRIADWNREDSDDQLQYQEFNWAEDDASRGFAWRRCYGLPTDGTHRAVAAQRLGVPVWVTIHEYLLLVQSGSGLSLARIRGWVEAPFSGRPSSLAPCCIGRQVVRPAVGRDGGVALASSRHESTVSIVPATGYSSGTKPAHGGR